MAAELGREPLPLPMPLLDQSTEAVAVELVAVYAAIGDLPDKVQRVYRAIEQRLVGAAGDPALAAAGRAVAAAIDANSAVHDRHPYHGRQHFCEVMLAVERLCQVHRLGAADAQQILFAALIHDIGHDGEPSPTFHLERCSLELAAPYTATCGVTPAVSLRLAALVLATQPGQGVAAAVAARAFHVDGAALPAPCEAAPELALLAHDERLCRLALLLCEADLLPSVALTFAHAMRLQDRLSREWGCHLGPKDKLAFQRKVLSSGVIGDFFRPNAVAILQALVERVDGAHER